MCPFNARLIGGEGGWTEPAHLVCHTLAIETSEGIVLVDTGLGSADCADPARTGVPFRLSVRPRFELAETAIERLRDLGFQPADVRHILLTHLDVDHAGGLGDFPQAKVHVFATELETAVRNPGWRARTRYVSAQWAHGPDWVPYATEGDSWFGFDSVRAIEGLDPEVAIVPLIGHTFGHSGIAVRDGERWLLHAGDSYFNRREIESPPRTPPGLKVFETVTEFDGRARRDNQQRLRDLAARHSEEVEIFCAHDPVELERYRDPS